MEQPCTPTGLLGEKERVGGISAERQCAGGQGKRRYRRRGECGRSARATCARSRPTSGGETGSLCKVSGLKTNGSNCLLRRIYAFEAPSSTQRPQRGKAATKNDSTQRAQRTLREEMILFLLCEALR